MSVVTEAQPSAPIEKTAAVWNDTCIGLSRPEYLSSIPWSDFTCSRLPGPCTKNWRVKIKKNYILLLLQF
jgi:hypothetical protein